MAQRRRRRAQPPEEEDEGDGEGYPDQIEGERVEEGAAVRPTTSKGKGKVKPAANHDSTLASDSRAPVAPSPEVSGGLRGWTGGDG